MFFCVRQPIHRAYFLCFLFFFHLLVSYIHSLNVRPSYILIGYYYPRWKQNRRNIQVILFLFFFYFFAYLLSIMQVKSWIDCQNRIMMMAIIETSIWHGFNCEIDFYYENSINKHESRNTSWHFRKTKKGKIK